MFQRPSVTVGHGRTTIMVDRNAMTVLGSPDTPWPPRLLPPLTAPRRAANLNRRRYLALVGRPRGDS